jgi:RNA polymerase sigma-70 factor, ECF subfamily
VDRETELRLVAALRRGETPAFDAVYEEYRPRLFAFVLRLVGQRAIGEELSQEAWLRLATRAATLREDTRLAPWLFTVARNLCLSYRRARGLDDVGASELELEDLPDTRSPSPLRSAEGSELGRRLERALRRLPARYRETLLLVGAEGLAPAEAAVVCGIRPEALRKRLERARVLLASELQSGGTPGTRP